MPFAGIGDTLVLNQLSADIRKKVRPHDGGAVGDKIHSAKNGALFVTNASVKLAGVFKKLKPNAAWCQAALSAVGHDTGFGIDKRQFIQFIEIVHFSNDQFNKPRGYDA